MGIQIVRTANRGLKMEMKGDKIKEKSLKNL